MSDHDPESDPESESGAGPDAESASSPAPRRFKLVRHADPTGVAGTGVVAYGIEYPDGAVHMQWQNEDNERLSTYSNGCAFKPAPDGLAATEEVHGHGGSTEVVFYE